MSEAPFNNSKSSSRDPSLLANREASRSVGPVSPETYHFDQPLALSCGRTLRSYDLVVETYGQLNAAKTNAVLVCHALSGNHHAAGYYAEDDKKPGWWDDYIGPGKPIDSERFFIVCLNNIGGCDGSTGPRSIDPDTGKAWGKHFPPLRVRDWVSSQADLADRLGIEQWAVVIGGSLGGMNAMRWAVDCPERVRHCVVIASALKLTAQNIAFNEIARRAIRSDPDFHDGDFAEHDTLPRNGLALARMVGHVTYLSDALMGLRFGRELSTGSLQRGLESPVEFQVESYLQYQGEKFAESFDANTYLLITKMLDYFDLARDYQDDPVRAFKQAQCKFLVVSFTSDWRFAPDRSREIVNALIAANRDVSSACIESDMGHDAFLLPNERYETALGTYMARVAEEC
ncbi:MAG: homoserine O-acetyltransferase [Porticoccaceae bacterium]|nr:homoserine O-acetyltransferase [Porticoccaceae bacterium]